jgi:hypothetical protein
MPGTRLLNAARAAARNLRWWLRRLFWGKHEVVVREGPFPPELYPGVRFECYRSPEDIPAWVAEAIKGEQGEETLKMDLVEIRDGSVMWAALVDDRLAGLMHSRRGRMFRRWFVHLRDDDIVIFRARTFPDFRGRGISPAMHRHIMNVELTDSDRAYADSALYNTPSRRCLEKVGYRVIAVMTPITREWALHQRDNQAVK